MEKLEDWSDLKKHEQNLLTVVYFFCGKGVDKNNVYVFNLDYSSRRAGFGQFVIYLFKGIPGWKFLKSTESSPTFSVNDDHREFKQLV